MLMDFMIVGQGLAGSLLGFELLRRGQSVLVVDNGLENASSVAAGLINPVTGPRMAKTDWVDTLLPTANQFYTELSLTFKQTFFVERELHRLLLTVEERQVAQDRLKQSSYHDYLSEILPGLPEINAPYGCLRQKQAGYLKTRALLTALREHFIAQSSYVQADYRHSELVLQNTVQWRQWRAKTVIFCEGHLGSANPWFNWLPFRPVKGEIITATTAQPLPAYILNYGHWMLPLPENGFKTGASFTRDDLSTAPTKAAREALLRALYQVYPRLKPVDVLSQRAGIRPATVDRQPFLGLHPLYRQLAIFNGFGAKGSLLMPYYCQSMADFLLKQQTLPKQCDIKRFYDSYFLT